RLGLVYQATDNTVLHAGYARYFTPPATEAITTANIHKFDGTTNALPDDGNNTPLAERSDYFDVGVQQNIGDSLTLGLDAYYRKVTRLQDEGQFGAALVYSTFNYAKGRIKGVEFTANYDDGPLSAYFNLAASRAMGKRVITGQYNFDPDDLAYVANHYIFLDHDQKYASSGGISYAFGDGTRVGADYLFSSGLRKDGKAPNGASLPAYFQLNLSLSRDFTIADAGKLHVRLAMINALDRVYELRDGTGIGVGAPQYGARRGFYLGIDKDF
ncbi:MAG TPA: TonB-dependent receptor, partial [Oleiagrimonas sp.]|nr:TonB-dependent receptor [Oleiagrimonas sp.]